MTEHEAYIALNLMEKVGPVKVRALRQALGSVTAIFTASPNELQRADGVGAKAADHIISQRDQIATKTLAAELAKAKKFKTRIITLDQADYPEVLKSIHDAPLALYVFGELLPQDKHAIAVVGSRRTSHYGLQVADKLSYQLGNVGFTVVSGLARGIDTAAHKGALKGSGRTIAVLGSAIDELYPKENAELARDIAKRGAVISEFPFGTAPGRTTFPMRNRIVTGLSSGVLVVEAGRKSGAIISANEAVAQGRPLFAVPGRIDNPGAAGCHMLIKDGAKLVEDVRDITDEFEYLISPSAVDATTAGAEKKKADAPRPALSEPEETILAHLELGPTDVDSLIRATKINPARVSGLLIGLEMKRMITMLPGRIVERS